MAVEFSVEGPFDVPYLKKLGGQFLNAECGTKLFEKHHTFGHRRGVYVFCLKVSKGILPVYVGKATKSFSQEVFTPDKLLKYNEAMMDYKNDWKPALFLLTHGVQKGKTNNKAIDELETFLIEVAKLRNPYLKNIQKTKKEISYSIRGVYNSGQGAPTSEAKHFKKAMGL